MRDTIVWPIVLILLGVLFLLHNLGFLQWRELRVFLGTWWPVILIAVGAAQLARRRK